MTRRRAGCWGIIVLLLIPLVLIIYYRFIRSEAPLNQDYQFIKIVDGLSHPVYITHMGDERLFIVEQAGRVMIVENGRLLPEPFLDIQDVVDDSGFEKGLLSIAFDPLETGVFYVNYTAEPAGDTVIARYRVSASNPNLADPNSPQTVIEIHQPYPNHNGGQLQFGADGYLYIGMGDGGSGGDPQGKGQSLDTLLGKLLRIDVRGDLPYSVPADNPFVGQADVRPEIWAYGLRNPWRFSFDRLTGDLYIGDVGQNALEEIDFRAADSRGGENYGWNRYEANQPYKGDANTDGLTMPIHSYHHKENFFFVEKFVTRTAHCSVTGGYVYRGTALPDLQGTYLYGDYCSGSIWTLRRAGETWRNTPFIATAFSISSFGEDAQGELYLSDWSGGAVWKLVAR
jgi:glucose/arabinose dehydrogenase